MGNRYSPEVSLRVGQGARIYSFFCLCIITATPSTLFVCLFVETATPLTLPKSWERIQVVRRNKVTVQFSARWHFHSEFAVIRIHRRAKQKAIEQNPFMNTQLVWIKHRTGQKNTRSGRFKILVDFNLILFVYYQVFHFNLPHSMYYLFHFTFACI